MASGDDDYGEAFKKAKLEHDHQLEAPTEAKRLQAEADADIAVLSNVVLPQLQAAAQKLHPLGGKVEIRQYGRTGKTLKPASIAFRITDQQDQPGLRKGPPKPRLFDCSARRGGHGHLRRRFRRDRPTETTQERKRGDRYPAPRGRYNRECQKTNHACDRGIPKRPRSTRRG